MTAGAHRSSAILATCCLGQFLMVLDASAINVALQSIGADLDFTPHTLQWVITAYTVVLCGFLLLSGRLTDLYGQRGVLMAGAGVFTGASLLAGLATGAVSFIAARSLQGLGVAVMVPATLAIIGTTFTEPRRRARALGLWSAIGGGGGAAGAIIGGTLVGLLGWRWVPLADVPIGLAVLVLAHRVLPRHPGRRAGAGLDVAGAGSITVGLMAFVYAVTEGPAAGWDSARVLVAFAAAGLLLAFFVVDQAVLAEHPIIPLGVFRDRTVSAANGVAVFASGALGSTFYFCTLLFLGVLAYSPQVTGVLYLPLALSIFVGAWSVARLVPRVGPRPILVAGMGLAATGLAWLSLAGPGSGYLADVLGPCLLLGIGEGFVMTATTAAATDAMPPEQAGLASGLLNTTRQLGTAVSLAVLASVAAARTEGLAGAGVGPVDAAAAGYRLAFLAAAGLLVAGLVIALVMPRVPARPPVAVPARV